MHVQHVLVAVQQVVEPRSMELGQLVKLNRRECRMAIFPVTIGGCTDAEGCGNFFLVQVAILPELLDAHGNLLLEHGERIRGKDMGKAESVFRIAELSRYVFLHGFTSEQTPEISSL